MQPAIEIGTLDWRNVAKPRLIAPAAISLIGIPLLGWLMLPIFLGIIVAIRALGSLSALPQVRRKNDASYELYASVGRTVGRLRLTTDGMVWRPRRESAEDAELRFSWNELSLITIRPAVAAQPVCFMLTDAAESPRAGFALSVLARRTRRVLGSVLVGASPRQSA